MSQPFLNEGFFAFGKYRFEVDEARCLTFDVTGWNPFTTAQEDYRAAATEVFEQCLGRYWLSLGPLDTHVDALHTGEPQP